MTARLHRYQREHVTAADALAWLTGRQATPGPGTVIGYLLAPDRAEWFRCQDTDVIRTGPSGPDRSRDLSGAFELYATDGSCHLRWLHDNSGTGTATSLSEDPGLLPGSEELPSGAERQRLGGTAARLLAGTVIAAHDGWATLASARYAPCQVPVTAERDQEVWADLAEYVVCDDHGNLSVADTLLLGLHARTAPPKEGR